jgi:hypothetical protein
MMPAAETLAPTETPSFLSAQKIDRVRLSHTIKAHNARYLGARRHALSERQKFDRSGVNRSVCMGAAVRDKSAACLTRPWIPEPQSDEIRQIVERNKIDTLLRRHMFYETSPFAR